ncbi:hypothetical protein HU200_023665 [Digitaria exilis]|uniref:Protein TIFY n=1 Tax=Digitaria exilis TaxID=1010633 RepID=A0A835C3K4_9POAL|nr:hypothetical protein HU200_023665 [Digitaria exilis]CAB3494794.1 unnamed protein product [Digitaria exilis]CAB3499751.1 unnamed protein product [Digitaria exilis]
MAAAAPASGATGGGAWPATSRFAAACGALSQYVRAAAEAERGAQHARPRPLPLMPGADVDAAGEDPAQMTIVYGGRVVVLDDVPADKAASLLRLAAAAATEAVSGQGSAAADLPVARKASLQRFMEKRKVRAAARGAPYRRTDETCPEDNLKLAL